MENFSRSMTGEQLCAYLEDQGLEGEDLRKIREGGYNGTTILSLSRNRAEQLHALGLTAAANMVFEILFEDECVGGEDTGPLRLPADLAYPPPLPPDPLPSQQGPGQPPWAGSIAPAYPYPHPPQPAAVGSQPAPQGFAPTWSTSSVAPQSYPTPNQLVYPPSTLPTSSNPPVPGQSAPPVMPYPAQQVCPPSSAQPWPVNPPMPNQGQQPYPVFPPASSSMQTWGSDQSAQPIQSQLIYPPSSAQPCLANPLPPPSGQPLPTSQPWLPNLPPPSGQPPPNSQSWPANPTHSGQPPMTVPNQPISDSSVIPPQKAPVDTGPAAPVAMATGPAAPVATPTEAVQPRPQDSVLEKTVEQAPPSAVSLPPQQTVESKETSLRQVQSDGGVEEIEEPDGVDKTNEAAESTQERSYTLEAMEESQEYASFGLGYGIDATDPAPLRGKHGKIRIVLSNLTNVEEIIKKERKVYEEIISSVVSYSASISASVSELVANGVSISAEGELTREKTNELIVEGERMTIREVAFKPFCSDEYHSASSEDVEDSQFENVLCKYLLEEIPTIADFPGKTDAEKVQVYLLETPNKRLAIDKIFVFLKTEKITHYINSIALGASKYSVSASTKTALSVGASKSLGVEFIGQVGIGAKRGKEKSNTVSKEHFLGDIETVQRGQGEAVIGYDIVPLFMLCRHNELKKVLQEATKLYLERESGPFIIKCGHNYDRYLKITLFGKNNALIATKVKAEAYLFYIEKSVCPGEFNIAYYGGQGAKGTSENPPLYVRTNSKLTGKEEGPLKVGINRGANFILGNVVKEKDPPSISAWENHTCFIRCAPRKSQHKSFLALDEDSDFVMCVQQRKSQKEGSIWMLFKVERVQNEESTRVTVYRAPLKRVFRAELSYDEDKEEDEEEFDFDYAFGQITESSCSDSDEEESTEIPD